MAKTPTFRYFEIDAPTGVPQLSFRALGEFYRFVESQHGKHILVYSKDTVRRFLLVHESLCYSVADDGFKTLEDYHDARDAGYPDAARFYEGASWGCATHGDYSLLKATGVSDPETIRQMNEKGYVQGFEEFKALPTNTRNAIDTPHQLFLAGEKGGFGDFAAFLVGHTHGFDDHDEYLAAKSKGYQSHADYAAGQEGGFLHGDEFRAAQAVGITDREGYLRYNSLLHGDTAPGHDVQLLRSLLATSEPGKRLSINKISDFLKEQKATYRQGPDEALPAWFSESLTDKAAIAAYFAENKDTATFGSYDPDGEFFEVNQLNAREVVIDGSNVAHGHGNRDNRKPTLYNLLIVARRLRELGIERMVIIVDASLKHRMADGKDKKKMGELKLLADYREAPSGTSADVFLIDYVRNHQCKVVTNDQFREWKLQDAWVSLNIDHYRLPFMIDGKAVVIQGLN